MRIGILTAGGDCPGINAAIRSVGKTAIIRYKMKVFGIASGYSGLIHNEYIQLDEERLSGLLTLGGTILGTSREKPFKKENGKRINSEKPALIKKNYHRMKLDCLVCIGGNGTQKIAAQLHKEGLHVVGIPKTIDNDVWGTDLSFGFDSAVSIATEAIDRLHTTANSHKRVMVIEVMGHHTGWLALYSGIAGGGDVILIPELDYDEKIVAEYLLERSLKMKAYSIVVVAEGIARNGKAAAQNITKRMNELTGLEIRETVLGYIQRGGTPTATDRILATRFGAEAVELIVKKKFGTMVALKNGIITAVPLKDVAGRIKTVSPNDNLIVRSKKMGTSFGDERIFINPIH